MQVDSKKKVHNEKKGKDACCIAVYFK